VAVSGAECEHCDDQSDRHGHQRRGNENAADRESTRLSPRTGTPKCSSAS